MQQADQEEIINPVLSTIFEVSDGAVVSVKGDVGNDCARALQEVYAKKIDPASGYTLESMQQDQELQRAIGTSVVSEKNHYNDQNKYYNLIWTVDPVKISPVDLIDFKAAANETTNDEVDKSTMVIYIPDEPVKEASLSPVMNTVKQVADQNNIKIIYGLESIMDYVKGL